MTDGGRDAGPAWVCTSCGSILGTSHAHVEAGLIWDCCSSCYLARQLVRILARQPRSPQANAEISAALLFIISRVEAE